mgnify:CR=1 FL=1
MFTVMLIDDEPIILDKLRNIVDWRKLQCQVVAEADNGLEALKLCRRYKPQIIVCDIYMPLMDGLVFSTEIKKILPESIIILISGFDDFHYAQQAITTGVFRYLLKPIWAEELKKTINEAKEVLLFRKAEAEEKARLKKVVNRSIPALREKFFRDLIIGELDNADIAEHLSFLHLKPAGAFFGVIAVHLDNLASLMKTVAEAALHLYKFHLLSMLKNGLQPICEFIFAFMNKPQEIVVIYGIHKHEQLEVLYHTLLQVQERFFKTYCLTFSAGIGGVYQELSFIKNSYHEADLALDFKMWTGTNALIPYSDLKTSNAGRLLYSQEHEVLTSALRDGDQEKAGTLIRKIFLSLKSQDGIYVTKTILHLTVLDVVNQITRTLLEFGGKIEDLREVFNGEFDPLAEVNRYETLEALENWVQGLSRRAIDYINRHKQEISKNFVEKARRYLEENFADPELNLSTVADRVYVSPCYLSHLFKEVTGSNVTEYLNRIRIHQGKKLLKDTNLKIYEIAERVGFRDSHYFGIVFKKLMGLSPGEYRDKVQIDHLL